MSRDCATPRLTPNAMPPKHNKGYFSRSKDKILIELVRMNSVLYDDGHDNFRDPVMKHLIWENISAAIDVPTPIVKKRWRHFRDHYLKKSRDRTAGRGRQTWEYMERLNFLEFLTRGRRPASPGSPEPAAVKESVIYVVPPGEHDSFSEVEDAEPAAKRTRQSPETVEVCFSPNADELQPRAAASYSDAPRYSTCIPLMGTPAVGEERSAVHKFFESMADIVAELPAPLVAEARLRICKLVNELETTAQQAAAGAAGCPRCQAPPQPDS